MANGNSADATMPGMSMHISSDNVYTFGFSGWKAGKGKPIYDEFELYVWEQRKAAGFDEPMPEPIAYEQPTLSWTNSYGSGIAGQILYSGKLTAKSPKYHRQVYGFTSGPDNSSDE